MENQYIANLGFLLKYDKGDTKDEIEYELYKIAFQIRDSIHYDRSIGGDFESLEQENSNEALIVALKFATSMIQSIYFLNEERGFDPYIVVGFSDIETERVGTTFNVTLKYRLLKDLTIQGKISMEL